MILEGTAKPFRSAAGVGAQALRANGAAAPSRFSDIQKVVSPWLQRAAQQPPWKTDVPFVLNKEAQREELVLLTAQSETVKL